LVDGETARVVHIRRAEVVEGLCAGGGKDFEDGEGEYKTNRPVAKNAKRRRREFILCGRERGFSLELKKFLPVELQ
jgi:hypothetical protein